jgi:hypothetical protein
VIDGVLLQGVRFLLRFRSVALRRHQTPALLGALQREQGLHQMKWEALAERNKQESSETWSGGIYGHLGTVRTSCTSEFCFSLPKYRTPINMKTRETKQMADVWDRYRNFLNQDEETKDKNRLTGQMEVPNG